MKIATILPYKENYVKNGAGAVSLWVKDFHSVSKFKDNIIFGSTTSKKLLSKNFVNIDIKKDNFFLSSATRFYTNSIINHLNKNICDIIEIHNRPIIVKDFKKKLNSKIILFFHNDPQTMKGSKSPSERIYLLNITDKIIFISKWIKKRFFEGIDEKNDIKTSIIYHSIKPTKKFLKKKKQIIFVGKLNYSKGYDIFCLSLINILNEFKNWKALTIGDEKRFQEYNKHPRQFHLGLLSNDKVLKQFEKSEIAIVPSRWEEPFGRTALEATSRGCATIISERGGLTETSDYTITLKDLNVATLTNQIRKIILNNKKRKLIQKKSQKFVKHQLIESSKNLDDIRKKLFPFSYFSNLKNFKILNIYNLSQKNDYRIYNLSLGKKLTNGFIRNNNDVIEISDRDYIRSIRGLNLLNIKKKFNEHVINTIKNYNPNIFIFGHSENINPELLSEIKSINKNIIISQWNEDPFNLDNLTNSQNLNKIVINKEFVDHTFITTSPDIDSIKNSNMKNIHFFLTPVDKIIECYDVYKLNPKNDLFYAMSHGVNRAKLKKGKIDQRSVFLEKLIKINPSMKYDFYGYNNQQPIWGNNFYTALTNNKMALNLSRGKPTKYYSSNRIATMIGNALLTFIDKKVFLSDFFNKNEIAEYENIDDLSEKITFYSKNDKLRKKIAYNGQKKYFKNFNEKIVSKYILDISIGKKNSLY